MPASKVSPEIKAAALADLQGGEQPAVVAERYGLDREVVKKWGQRYKVTMSPHMSPHSAGDISPAHPRPPPIRPSIEAQQRHIGEIVLDLLRAKLEASATIARVASTDPEWITRQSGAELAAFGQWLDSTALAIGDRLASGAQPAAGDEGEPV